MSYHDRQSYYNPIKVDSKIDVPNERYTPRPINEGGSLWIDPNMPLPMGPKSGRITDPAIFRHRDISYMGWNPELGEYESMSKFSKYGVMFSSYGPAWDEQRARNQTSGEKWWNGLRKAGVTFGGAVVENTLGIVAGVGELMDGGQYHNNEIGQMVDGWNKWARKAMPNYVTEAERNAGLWDRMWSYGANFWGDKVANGLGYSLGSLATIYLTGGYGVVGLTAKGISNAAKVSSAVSKTNKIYKLYKVAKGTERGEKLLNMYSKVNNLTRLKNGALMLEAGAMMSLAESSVEARETQNNIKAQLTEEAKEKYPDGIPESVMAEIESLSQSAGNMSFVGNMAVLSLSNIAMFNKFLAGGVSKANLKSTARGIVGRGLEREGKKTIVDTGRTTFLRKLRTSTKPLRRGARIEGIQEGSQYAINVASTEYYTSRFDNKGGINMMHALFEGISRTFGETEGLESIMLGVITGGIMGGVSGIRETKQRNKLAAKVQKIMNDDSFMNIINRSQANTVTSHYLDKADKYRAEGKHDLADQAMTQALINEISTLDNAGTISFFTERLEDFRSLSDVEFKKLFGIAEDIEINKNEVIDNMLQETENIIKRKNALDLMFPAEKTRGLPRHLMNKVSKDKEDQEIKETEILKAQLLHNAVFLDTVTQQKKDKAKDIDRLYPGITLSVLEEQSDLAVEQFDYLVEQYIRNAAATGQLDDKGNPIQNINQIPQDDLNNMHREVFLKFTQGISDSITSTKMEHPLDKEALVQELQDYYFLHRNLQDLMESWNRLQTTKGRTNYIRAALLDGEQSIKDAGNRRADEIINSESDPVSALTSIPSTASKQKRTEIENEVKKMQKQELTLMDKYGATNVTVDTIDNELEKTRNLLEALKDNPKEAKYLRHKINVLETIKAVKLKVEDSIEKINEDKANEEQLPQDEKVEKTGRGRKQIDKIKEKYKNAKQPQEKLKLIQSFINNVYQGAEATQEEIDFFNSEIEALKKEGFELDMKFQPGVQWNEGDIVEITASMPDENLPEGVIIINRVSDPGIIKDGKTIKRAVVETRVGTKKGTGREALVEAANKAEDIPGVGKKKLAAMKKAKQALNEFDRQFQNPFNLADLVSEESQKAEKPRYQDKQVPVKREEFTVYNEDGTVHGVFRATTNLDGTVTWKQQVEGMWTSYTGFGNFKGTAEEILQQTFAAKGRTGWQGSTYKAGKVESYDTVMNPKMWDRLTADQQNRVDSERAKGTEPKVLTKTEVRDIVQEEEISTEDVIIKEEINPEEEQRLIDELQDDSQIDLENKTAEIDQIPLSEMDGYYQDLLKEEEELRKRLEEEDDNCKT